jgi:hypothetical protein
MDIVDHGKEINYEAIFNLMKRYFEALFDSIDTPLVSIPWYAKLIYVVAMISDLFFECFFVTYPLDKSLRSV